MQRHHCGLDVGDESGRLRKDLRPSCAIHWIRKADDQCLRSELKQTSQFSCVMLR
jgi:hypothetical protein